MYICIYIQRQELLDYYPVPIRACTVSAGTGVNTREEDPQDPDGCEVWPRFNQSP